MNRLKNIFRWLNSHKEYGFEFIRIYLGLILLLRGLIQFTPSGHPTTAILLDAYDRSWPSWILDYVIFAHLCGGAFLTLGLLTRLAALIQIPVLLGAVFFVHWEEGLIALGQSLEFSSLVLILLILIFVYGPGLLSLDYYMFGRSELDDNEIEAEEPTKN